jgi:IclR family transcriptional regulator, pca regulon regulatory protein
MRQTTGGAGASQSLERGLAVLSSFGPDRPTLGISQLARELGLTRSTTHRYVATLASLRYLEQDRTTRKYRLGPRVLDLGFAMLGSLELREIAAPHLRQLTDTTGHTSNLAIRDDTDVILIDRVRGRPGRYHHLEFTLHVGSRLPSYCSATGKALLAFLPRPDLDRLLDRIELVQRGPRTVTTRARCSPSSRRCAAPGSPPTTRNSKARCGPSPRPSALVPARSWRPSTCRSRGRRSR